MLFAVAVGMALAVRVADDLAWRSTYLSNEWILQQLEKFLSTILTCEERGRGPIHCDMVMHRVFISVTEEQVPLKRRVNAFVAKTSTGPAFSVPSVVNPMLRKRSADQRSPVTCVF